MTIDAAERPGKFYSYLMMIGHICCDMNQSTIPALLPFLVAQRGIDYAAAAGLMFASSSLSSLIQPLLGMMADRRQMPWLMGAGIMMTGLGIASIGFLDSYWGIFAVVMFAGFGSALFHPEGARMANGVAGEKKGRAMSNFTTGGNLGFVIGPIVAAFAVSTWGLRGTAVALIPTIAVSSVFFGLQKKLASLSKQMQREMGRKASALGQKDDWPAFSRLFISILARSIVQNGVQTFVPLYWMSVLMRSQQQGSLMVTVMALASTAAAFTGGRLADRFGFRKIIRLAFSLMFPLIILMLMTKSVVVATVIVVLLAAMINLGHSPSVVLGQRYLPNRLGLASGVTLGLAVSVGGICSPLLGRIGDNYGLTTAFYVVAGVALLGFAGTLLLREPQSAAEPSG